MWHHLSASVFIILSTFRFIALSAAHPQVSGGDYNNIYGNPENGLDFIALRINHKLRILDDPKPTELHSLKDVDAVETFNFVSDSHYGCVFVKAIPLSDFTSAFSVALAAADEAAGRPAPIPDTLNSIGLTPTLYYEDSKIHSFRPPFEADMMNLFRLPEPDRADREIIVWIEYTDRPANGTPKIRYANVSVKLGRPEVPRFNTIAQRVTLRRAVILHSQDPNVRCRAYFADRPPGENQDVLFTRSSPFVGPTDKLLGLACF